MREKTRERSMQERSTRARMPARKTLEKVAARSPARPTPSMRGGVCVSICGAGTVLDGGVCTVAALPSSGGCASGGSSLFACVGALFCFALRRKRTLRAPRSPAREGLEFFVKLRAEGLLIGASNITSRFNSRAALTAFALLAFKRIGLARVRLDGPRELPRLPRRGLQDLEPEPARPRRDPRSTTNSAGLHFVCTATRATRSARDKRWSPASPARPATAAAGSTSPRS